MQQQHDMASFAESLEKDLERAISDIESEGKPERETLVLVIDAIKKIVDQLREFVSKNGFASKSAEINFFKRTKPQFVSQLIYYWKRFQLEISWPRNDLDAQSKVVKKELEVLQDTYNNNQAFYQYYRSGAVYLDDRYFLRSERDIHFAPSVQWLSANDPFSTAHDFLIAELLANERYAEVLYDRLRVAEGRGNGGVSGTGVGAVGKGGERRKLIWTETKTALFELIYAVFSVGAINNGNTEIKEIANFFADGFNVDVGNIYRAAQEMRIRKINRTKFLSKMVKKVEERWDEQDENPKQ